MCTRSRIRMPITMDPTINYCSVCGSGGQPPRPAGDSLPRHVCDACGTIHYRNPRLVVGALPVWEDRVLLCRRAIEPRHGMWTLPAGFMENGETVAEAALRETREEANAHIALGEMFTLISVPHISQVHVVYPRPPARPRFFGRRGNARSRPVRAKTRSPGTTSPSAPSP